MTLKKPHKSLVTGKEIKGFFLNSDLAMIEFEDISQTISYLLIDASSKLDQEARKYKFQRNLKKIEKHLNIASVCMQGLPTNKTKDIGITFDDWIEVQGIINRLEQAKKISTYKAHKQRIFGELFYYIHFVLTGIETEIKLGWRGREELTKFEEILHFLLKKIGVSVVSDKGNKIRNEDIPEGTIKTYIKVAKKVYDKHRKK